MKFTHLDGIQDLKEKGKALCAAAFNTPSSFVALAIKFNGVEMSRDAERKARKKKYDVKLQYVLEFDESRFYYFENLCIVSFACLTIKNTLLTISMLDLVVLAKQ
ncbi:hypothetical protein TNIN_442571 [Trichonephila inaurata madagascariensis]|uniref:Uncharacterized protein n=1 Tax=Trichonephila inaurata madagascariensis TaxID=2747483 RepID=A0A8X6XIK7_9ARAC|nr:hypothetical protein TNIN_442571 [Trichonephila inaurata madagascariensis]